MYEWRGGVVNSGGGDEIIGNNTIRAYLFPLLTIQKLNSGMKVGEKVLKCIVLNQT